MPSPFDPQRPGPTVESKIVVALERVATAFRVLLWNEGRTHGLSPIQVQLLLFLRFHPRERCKVSVLAQEFNLTKATISESVRALELKGLVHKQVDPADGRSQVIGLAPAGRKAAAHAADFAQAIEQPLAGLPAAEKEAVLAGLLKLIRTLNQAGVITVQRMCLTCAHHALVDGGHYCKLLNAPLRAAELRVDCPEHEAVA